MTASAEGPIERGPGFVLLKALGRINTFHGATAFSVVAPTDSDARPLFEIARCERDATGAMRVTRTLFHLNPTDTKILLGAISEFYGFFREDLRTGGTERRRAQHRKKFK